MTDFRNQNKILKLTSSEGKSCYVDFIRLSLINSDNKKIPISLALLRVLDALLEVPGKSIPYSEVFYLLQSTNDYHSSLKNDIYAQIRRLRKRHPVFATHIQTQKNYGYYYDGQVVLAQDKMEEIFSLKMEGQFNYDMVHFSDRETIDQKYRLDRLEGAKAIYCLNLAATSLLHHEVLLNDPRHQSVADLICRQTSADIKFIIPQEGGICEYDAIKYKMLEPSRVGSAKETLKMMRDDLLKACSENSNIHAKFTNCPLTYGILAVTYDDPAKDHIKVDLCDPYVVSVLSRRSFVIRRESNPTQFDFFMKQFYKFWNNASDEPICMPEERINLPL